MGLPIVVESPAPATPGRRASQRQRVQPARHPADHARAAGPVLRLGGRAGLFRGPALRGDGRDPRHPQLQARRPAVAGPGAAAGSSRRTCARVGLSATVDDPGADAALAVGTGGRGRSGRWAVPARRRSMEVLLSEGRVPWAGHTAQHAMAEVYEAIKTAPARAGLRQHPLPGRVRLPGAVAAERGQPAHRPAPRQPGGRAAAQGGGGAWRGASCGPWSAPRPSIWASTGAAVDLVIQLAAPKGASRLVQRIGRANHRLDEPRRALLVPANRFEMLECQAAREAVAENALDGEPIRVGALDVLAQHVMGCACSEPFDLLALYDEVRRAAPYRGPVLGGLRAGGRFRLHRRLRAEDLRPLPPDRAGARTGCWRVRNAETAQRHRHERRAPSSRPAMLPCACAGRRGVGGRKIGEVEEGFLEKLTPGDTFVFAGQVWRFVGITGPGRPGQPGRRTRTRRCPVLGRVEVRPVHLPGQAGAAR